MNHGHLIDICLYFGSKFCLFCFIKIIVVKGKNENCYSLICIIYGSCSINNTFFGLICHEFNGYIINLCSRSNINDE